MAQHDVTTDYGLAAYLREHGAINTWKHDGNNTAWYAPNGDIVASVQYDNTRSIKISVLTFK